MFMEVVAQSMQTADVLGLIPPAGGIAGGLYAVHLLLKRWDERDARNVRELWELVAHYRDRAEACEQTVGRYRSLYGPLEDFGG